MRNFSPWAAWMARMEGTPRVDPPPEDEEAITRWRQGRRACLEGLLGRLPRSVPSEVEVLESIDCGTYRRDRIVFDTEETMSVPAYLLVPHDRTAPGPAVIAQHGHGPGKSQVCGITADQGEETGGEPGTGGGEASTGPGGEPDGLSLLDDGGEDPNADYGHQLALRGYVVLAPDLRCFGERGDWNPPDHYGCDVNLVHAVLAGESPLTLNLWDLARAIDVLQAHPLVDAGRIGMVGLSYGGTMTLFLAAWDERIRAAVVSGYFSSVRDSHRMPWNMCGSQVLPGMLGTLEHVDLGALIAPRPLLVETGTEDLLFPVEVAKAGVAELDRVYRAMGAAGRLEHRVFDGGHRWDGVRAYPFLERWL